MTRKRTERADVVMDARMPRANHLAALESSLEAIRSFSDKADLFRVRVVVANRQLSISVAAAAVWLGGLACES